MATLGASQEITLGSQQKRGGSLLSKQIIESNSHVFCLDRWLVRGNKHTPTGGPWQWAHWLINI